MSRRFKICLAKGVGAFKAEARATEVYPCFKKNFAQRNRHKKQMRPKFPKYRFHNQSVSFHKGYPSLSILQFSNIGHNAFDSTPLPFEHFVEFFFSTDWEAICTALRLDNIRHRSEETMSIIS